MLYGMLDVLCCADSPRTKPTQRPAGYRFFSHPMLPLVLFETDTAPHRNTSGIDFMLSRMLCCVAYSMYLYTRSKEFQLKCMHVRVYLCVWVCVTYAAAAARISLECYTHTYTHQRLLDLSLSSWLDQSDFWSTRPKPESKGTRDVVVMGNVCKSHSNCYVTQTQSSYIYIYKAIYTGHYLFIYTHARRRHNIYMNRLYALECCMEQVVVCVVDITRIYLALYVV